MNNHISVSDANSLQIDISQCAHVFLDESWRYENVCDPFTRLYYIRDGEGYLRCGDKTIRLCGGNVYIVPAGCTFSYGCTALEKIFFHISVTAIEKYDLLSAVNHICVLPFSEADYITLLHCSASSDYMNLLKMKLILAKTIIDAAEKYHFEKMPVRRYSDIAERTLRYIQSHLGINLSVGKISKQLFVSESKIRKAFHDEMGMTIGQYIDDQVFFRARQLLARPRMSIGEISQRLGFCDQFYFSRRFKQKYNQTPSEFRREILLQNVSTSRLD